jgi:hypothetical protein
LREKVFGKLEKRKKIVSFHVPTIKKIDLSIEEIHLMREISLRFFLLFKLLENIG